MKLDDLLRDTLIGKWVRFGNPIYPTLDITFKVTEVESAFDWRGNAIGYSIIGHTDDLQETLRVIRPYTNFEILK